MTSTASNPRQPASAAHAVDDIEPAIIAVLERTLRKREQGPYSARSDSQVRSGLERLFAAHGHREVVVADLRRLAGGASKEMFCFSLHHAALDTPELLVLRMDPLESIIETSRQREAEAINAVRGTVPVPQVRYLDQEGEHLGQSALITSFVEGVTRPSAHRHQLRCGGRQHRAAVPRQSHRHSSTRLARRPLTELSGARRLPTTGRAMALQLV